MLRKFLDWQLAQSAKNKPLHPLQPMVQAMDTFFFEPPCRTKNGPHIRDAVDLKRWMSIVVFALMPCILMAIWNTGLQKWVYTSGNFDLMEEYIQASKTFSGYWDFALQDGRWLEFLKIGAWVYLPIMILSYSIGGFWELLFACIRRHEIAEGFLVTGMLYALILPPTIPYWMAAIGVSAGVVLGKEVFGGTGMNIFNPALACRAFLFFTFPAQMTGNIWVGSNPTAVTTSLQQINEQTAKTGIDAYTQSTPLQIFNISAEVKRVHVEAIAANVSHVVPQSQAVIEHQLSHWKDAAADIFSLSSEQLQTFVTDPLNTGGLGLSPELYEAAYRFAGLQSGSGALTDGNFFFGNQLGSMGETSVFACLIGAAILIYTGIGAWRTMLATVLGVFGFAWILQLCATHFGVDAGAWNPAKYAFPAYKHLILGGLAFGTVFMTTDPVSSPGLNRSRWIYGLLIGLAVVIIRAVNPAYPEGVMLAILMGNSCAPMIDYYAIKAVRRGRRVCSI